MTKTSLVVGSLGRRELVGATALLKALAAAAGEVGTSGGRDIVRAARELCEFAATAFLIRTL